jgi:hypothetical protein
LKYRGSSSQFSFEKFKLARSEVDICLLLVLTTKGAITVALSNIGLDGGAPGFARDGDAKLIAIDSDTAVSPANADRALKFSPDLAFSFGGQSFALRAGPLNTPNAGLCAFLGDAAENYFLVQPDSAGRHPFTGERDRSFTVKEIELWDISY